MITYMPWGKHINKPLRDVPAGYLRWVLNQSDTDNAELLTSVRLELARRGEPLVPPGQSGVSQNIHATVKQWYREMALEFHPDRRLDDGKAMAAINHAYERLKELFGLNR